MFVLGYIAGIATATLIVATLAYFRRVVEHKVTVIEKFIDSKAPRPEGFIIEPQSEADEVREKIIEENRRHGKDTKLSDLV